MKWRSLSPAIPNIYAKDPKIVQVYEPLKSVRPIGDQPFIPSLRTCNSSRSMPASARSALRAR